METKIVFANDLLAALASHEKQVTIRKGFRQYQVGVPLPVFAATGEQLSFDLVPFRVTLCKAQDVPEELCIADGFSSLDVMYECMASYYPDFGRETPVTVLEFETQDSL